MKLHPFYPIVDRAAAMAPLLPLGLGQIQLRAKGLSPDALRAEASAARDLCRRWNCLLIVNDAWELALDLGLQAVHLGQEDMAGADLAALRRAGIAYGISTHDAAELDRALGADPAYVALGPVYPTQLKVMPWAPQGLGKIRAWRAAIGKRPLVAIGGLTPERLALVRAAGADAGAVVTDLATAPDPVARARQWLAAAQCPDADSPSPKDQTA